MLATLSSRSPFWWTHTPNGFSNVFILFDLTVQIIISIPYISWHYVLQYVNTLDLLPYRYGHLGREHQGSVISLLLFLIYINDITQDFCFHTTLFADDVSLHMSNSYFNILQTTVNLELCKMTTGLEPTNLLLTTIRLILCY